MDRPRIVECPPPRLDKRQERIGSKVYQHELEVPYSTSVLSSKCGPYDPLRTHVSYGEFCLREFSVSTILRLEHKPE